MKFWEAALSLTITIPGNGPDYLPGAYLLGVLACPPSSPSDQKWRQAALLHCRAVLFTQQQVDPDWVTRDQLLVPEHILVSAADLPRKLQKLEIQIRHRLGAAQVALPFFWQANRLAGGAPAAVHRASTIDARVQKTIEQEAGRERWAAKRRIALKPRFPKIGNNFEHRFLRPSLPVLHIAVAVAVAIDQSQKALRAQPSEIQDGFYRDMGGPQINVADFLTNPDLVRHVIGIAEEYERLIPHLPKLPIPHVVSLRLE